MATSTPRRLLSKRDCLSLSQDRFCTPLEHIPAAAAQLELKNSYEWRQLLLALFPTLESYRKLEAVNDRRVLLQILNENRKFRVTPVEHVLCNIVKTTMGLRRRVGGGGGGDSSRATTSFAADVAEFSLYPNPDDSTEGGIGGPASTGDRESLLRALEEKDRLLDAKEQELNRLRRRVVRDGRRDLLIANLDTAVSLAVSLLEDRGVEIPSALQASKSLLRSFQESVGANAGVPWGGLPESDWLAGDDYYEEETAALGSSSVAAQAAAAAAEDALGNESFLVEESDFDRPMRSGGARVTEMVCPMTMLRTPSNPAGEAPAEIPAALHGEIECQLSEADIHRDFEDVLHTLREQVAREEAVAEMTGDEFVDAIGEGSDLDEPVDARRVSGPME